ncbi:MAG: cyclase family protein [Phycisphaeraceae bacterium]|nr:cyclase family protein [Phycisphaerales bacterium]QOJ17188.1 MAG: cyclase family protein [Phycisphaeraceae bacterium]
MLHDITPTITPDLAVWPGDTPATREVLMDMKRGHTVTLSTLRVTVHLGAHADAPSHYGFDAPSIESRPLEPYLGPCRVVHVGVSRGERFGLGHLSRARVDDLAGDAARGVRRALFRTGTFPDPCAFNEDFAAFDPALVDWLHERCFTLAGLDTPSVDLFHSKDLPSHKRFLAHDMAILEGVTLADVPEGVYELIALPLKLAGFDASPVRAVLRSIK